MMISNEAEQLLYQYEIDIDRGFLPKEDPLQSLPASLKIWDDFAHNLTSYVNAGIVREQMEKLPSIAPNLKRRAELERAMLLLSFFAHAYVNLPPKKIGYIPKTISIPWAKVAGQLGRIPMLSHASVVLNNWQRLDPNQPIQLNNLATLLQFHGGLDESWFYLITVNIERIGAKAIPLFLQAILDTKQGELHQAAQGLTEGILILEELSIALKQVYLHCDPYIFYKRVRPFLSSFEKVIYSGVNPEVRSYHGGSAAQSSLLQFFDAALGLNYNHNLPTKSYLFEMRKYMPPKHAQFLAYIETNSSLAEMATRSEILNKAYKGVVDQLIEFRNEHLKIVALYIIKQAEKTQSNAVGTGGTNPMHFLKSIRNQNRKLRDK